MKAETTRLPLFLHSRAAHADFVQVLRPHLAALRRNAGTTSEPNADEPGCVGVVHSFTGTADELRELLAELPADAPFPTDGHGPRGRQGSPAKVALPDGWLDDPDEDVIPAGAEIMHSGG